MPNTAKHKPRVILVTGDSSGIGYASCEHLAARGRTVYGASRREPKGVAWTHLHMDVTDEASVAKVVAITSEALNADADPTLWKEIVEDKNVALAILIGALSIGMCVIIAAAVH